MQVSGITQATASQSQASTLASAAKNAMDSNQFLTLLMAQLTHQNPMEPLKDSEMLGQFAQLNSVEELRNIRSLLSGSTSSDQIGYAASLIGKTIKATRAGDDDLAGVVTSITVESGKVYVHVGKQEALLDDVVEIKG
jgi:flagellar basal-body rod modification protein FlgD